MGLSCSDVILSVPLALVAERRQATKMPKPELSINFTSLKSINIFFFWALIIADTETLQKAACGQQLTTTDLPEEAVEGSMDTALADHIRVVDAQYNLKAVVRRSKEKTVYDYCCVFN